LSAPLFCFYLGTGSPQSPAVLFHCKNTTTNFSDHYLTNQHSTATECGNVLAV